MCRNIKTLFNFDPPATDEEIRAAAVQFTRKLSGFSKPSQANQRVFEEAIEDFSRSAKKLLDGLVTSCPTKKPRGWKPRRPGFDRRKDSRKRELGNLCVPTGSGFPLYPIAIVAIQHSLLSAG